MESISNNGDVKLKIKQVKMQTRRKQNKRNQWMKNLNKKYRNVRDECCENCMDNNETKIVNYNLLPRLNK